MKLRGWMSAGGGTGAKLLKRSFLKPGKNEGERGKRGGKGEGKERRKKEA